MSPSRGDLHAALVKVALSYPEAYEDFPWGELVVKVNKKVFVFFGTDGAPVPRLGLKLLDSHPQALSFPAIEPAGYGLGKSGWVNITLGKGAPPRGVLEDWVDESYRLVAPKRLVKQLDEVSAG
jgi:predicted DNA-binding protein (MmcQ/YjbR family)